MSNIIKLLLALCVFLATILFFQWLLMSESEKEISFSSSLSSTESDSKLELPELTEKKRAIENYSTMIEKPLFIQGRKPVLVNEGIVITEEVSKIDDLSLMGIYSLDQKQMALFNKKGIQSNYSKLSAGDSVSGWTLKEILADRVVLERNGQKQTLLLRKPRPQLKRRLARKKLKKSKAAIRTKSNIIPEKQND